jgi:pantetheine-phosphate adenylyltransferase
VPPHSSAIVSSGEPTSPHCMVTAIYPGSFDPVTKGHVDVVSRASHLFDTVIMAVVRDPGAKNALFDVSERLALLEASVSHLPNVIVKDFDGLLVDFARTYGATVIIRGLRAISDFETEFKMSQMNKVLYPECETVFVMASLEYTFLSSSMVKEVVRLGGDVTGLVPEPVLKALKALPLTSQETSSLSSSP